VTISTRFGCLPRVHSHNIYGKWRTTDFVRNLRKYFKIALQWREEEWEISSWIIWIARTREKPNGVATCVSGIRSNRDLRPITRIVIYYKFASYLPPSPRSRHRGRCVLYDHGLTALGD